VTGNMLIVKGKLNIAEICSIFASSLARLLKAVL